MKIGQTWVTRGGSIAEIIGMTKDPEFRWDIRLVAGGGYAVNDLGRRWKIDLNDRDLITLVTEQPQFHQLPMTGPYAALAAVLVAAFNQASQGKGKERHATADTPFEDQPMASINRQLGSIDGFVYQAHKKSLEAKRLPDGRAQAEMLGAINYLAGAVIALDSWAKKSG